MSEGKEDSSEGTSSPLMMRCDGFVSPEQVWFVKMILMVLVGGYGCREKRGVYGYRWPIVESDFTNESVLTCN